MKSPQKILESLNLRASKRRGQNFLTQPNSVKQIMDWAAPPKEVPILEIGPGLGAMTEEILKRGYPLRCVEIDRGLAQYLSDNFSEEPAFDLIQRDFLEIDWGKDLANEDYFVLANLPYSLSTPILERLIQHRKKVLGACLLLQEEVVRRIVAQPGEKAYGRLTLFLQNFFDCEAGPRISRNAFFPKPEIESRLLRLRPRRQTQIPPEQEANFFELTRLLFSQRRKTLRKILSLKFSQASLAAAEDQGFDLTRRPGTLSLPEIRSILTTLHSE